MVHEWGCLCSAVCTVCRPVCAVTVCSVRTLPHCESENAEMRESPQTGRTAFLRLCAVHEGTQTPGKMERNRILGPSARRGKIYTLNST